MFYAACGAWPSFLGTRSAPGARQSVQRGQCEVEVLGARSEAALRALGL